MRRWRLFWGGVRRGPIGGRPSLLAPQRWTHERGGSGGDAASSTAAPVPRRPRRQVRPAEEDIAALMDDTAAEEEAGRGSLGGGIRAGPTPPPPFPAVPWPPPSTARHGTGPEMWREDPDMRKEDPKLRKEDAEMWREDAERRREDAERRVPEDAWASRIHARQEDLAAAPVDVLVDTVTSYLRATTHARLVSREEEHVRFPVLLARLPELSVSQLLDVVEGPWARSTLARYGLELQDRVRDRLAQLATTAAHALAEPPAEAALLVEAPAVEDGRDPVLARAAAELTAETALRGLIVMGLSAGRRRRDAAFFQVWGAWVAWHVNHYTDPHDLVRVLTACARAKIRPSPRFRHLLGRRLPVLHKRHPLEPLPCYRAMVNFARMGSDQRNLYRFLADTMLQGVQARLVEERRAAAPGLTAGGPHREAAETNTERKEAEDEKEEEEREEEAGRRAKARLRRVTGLKPSMFTKWLHILSRMGAPHQQYLRPLIRPLIVPMLPYFPPPSFSRLLEAVRRFQSTDLELLEPIVACLCDRLAPAGRLLRSDVLVVLHLLSRSDTPVPANLERFLHLGHAAFSASLVGGRSEIAPTALVLRPQDMCQIASHLLSLQNKAEIPLEVLAPLTELMEHFAERFRAMMDLGTVSLTHVDTFADLCRQQQHPDRTGHIASMTRHRAALVGALGGEGAYESQLDIDVREVLRLILLLNDANTYANYLPLPGPMQVDFREALTAVSLLDVLKAVDLFERLSPGVLRATTARLLTRSLLAKIRPEGEEVISEDHRLVLRPPLQQFLTREDLRTLVELLHRTPLTKVKTSPLIWQFVQQKAQRLQEADVQAKAQRVLAEMSL